MFIKKNVFGKKLDYNRPTVSHLENSCVRCGILLHKNFKIFKNVQKIEKIDICSKKSINLFDVKKEKSPDYLWDNGFFRILLITSWCYYYGKYMFSPDFVEMATFRACNASTKPFILNQCRVLMHRHFHYSLGIIAPVIRAITLCNQGYY